MQLDWWYDVIYILSSSPYFCSVWTQNWHTYNTRLESLRWICWSEHMLIVLQLLIHHWIYTLMSYCKYLRIISLQSLQLDYLLYSICSHISIIRRYILGSITDCLVSTISKLLVQTSWEYILFHSVSLVLGWKEFYFYTQQKFCILKISMILHTQ